MIARLILALSLALGVSAVELPSADARKPARATRATKKKIAKKKPAPGKKLRADKGEIDPGRGAAKARVATGDVPRTALKAKRVDPTTLPLEEQTALKIEELLKGPLREGTTSLYVADERTGKPLFSIFPDDPLNPASNVKLISTAATLDILGPDYQYVTRLLGEAPDDHGTVAHDLYLLGSYDPTLDKAAIQELADALIADGVRTIAGDVLVGGTPTRDGVFRTWGEIKVTASSPGMPPAISITNAPSDFIVIENKAESSAKKRVKAGNGIKVNTSLFTDDAGHQRMKLTVTGTIGKNKSIVKDTFVKERAQYAAHLLRGALRDAGVAVLGDVRVVELGDYMDASIGQGFIPVPLAEHASQHLRDIVRRVNKRSTNWLADRLIMTAAGRFYREKPSKERAVDAMYRWLERHTGLTRKDVVVDGGSGLSYKTELSAKQLVAVLRAGLGLADRSPDLADDPAYTAYRDSLAIGGKDGTIKHRFKTLRGVLHGKTGTLQRVVALAGTLEVDTGRKVVFSIITNGHDPRWKKKIRGGQEQLVSLLCEYLHALPAPDGGDGFAGEPVIESIEPEAAVPGSRAALVLEQANAQAAASEAVELDDDEADQENDETDAEESPE